MIDTQQNEVAMMIFEQVQPELPRKPRQTCPPESRLSSLWQKADESVMDEEQPTRSEINTMVKEVRHSQNDET